MRMSDEFDPIPYRSQLSPPVLGAENYQITSEVAYGCMGSIVTVKDEKLQRIVAAKLVVLDADLDPSLQARFLREAKVLASLEHPNIVPIHDIVWEKDQPLFYTMKLVKGRTLQAILNDLSKSTPEVVSEFKLPHLLTIFRKVCDAIAFAHSKGVLHRDLKPDNIMVGEFGEVQVMDWGLAKRKVTTGAPMDELGTEDWIRNPLSAIDEKFQGTLHGAVLGTPSYMSPEQAQGRNLEVDEKSDIFALGGILFSILTLRPPIEGSSQSEVLNQAAKGQIAKPLNPPHKTTASSKDKALTLPLPHLSGGRIPAALLAVAMHALQSAPELRYDSVLALAEDIDSYLAGYATRAEGAGFWRQIWLLIQRHRNIAMTVGVILLLSLGFMFQVVSSGREAQVLLGTTREALATSQISLAEAAFREHNGKRMKDALESVPLNLRNTSDWHYFHQQADTSLGSIPLPTGLLINAAAPDPTRPHVFAVAYPFEGVIRMIHAQTLQELSSIPTPNKIKNQPWKHIRVLDVSPDGKRLVSISHGTSIATVQDIRSGEIFAEWPTPTSCFTRFSPDGQCILIFEEEGVVALYQADSGQLLWKEKETQASDFISSEEVLIFTSQEWQIRAASNGQLLRSVPNIDQRKPDSICLSADRKHVFAYFNPTGILEGFNIADGKSVFRQSVSIPTNKFFMNVTADGKDLVFAYSSKEGDVIIQNWDTNSGILKHHFLGSMSFPLSLQLHPLSADLLSLGTEFRSWSVKTRSADWTIPSARISNDAPDHSHRAVFFGSNETLLNEGKIIHLQADGNSTAGSENDLLDRFTGVCFSDSAADVAVIGCLKSSEPHPIEVLRMNQNGPTTLQTLLYEKGQLSHLRLSPDGSRLAMFGVDEWLQTHDLTQNQKLPECEYNGARPLVDACWTDNQRFVGIAPRDLRGGAGREEILHMWDTSTGQVIHSIKVAHEMLYLAACPSLGVLAEAGSDKKIHIRDAKTLEVQQELRVHDDRITALAFHPTLPLIATAGADYKIRLWDLNTAQIMEEFRPYGYTANGLRFSPSGRRLAVHSSHHEVHVWEIGDLIDKVE